MSETFDRAKLYVELERDEGRRARAYRDSLGVLTVGIGFNLEANDLPDDVIDRLFDVSIDRAVLDLDALEPRWRDMTPDRQRVLLNMAFNLGRKRLSGFKRFLAAIGEYLDGDDASALDRAAAEMLDSDWAVQVGARAKRLAARMRS